MSENKVDDLKLATVDSKHSHTKHEAGVSIHDPAANEAEQLVHEHDEFTPQEYKKLMLKVDLILMPMLMISELDSAPIASAPASAIGSAAPWASADSLFCSAEVIIDDGITLTLQSMVFSIPTRQVSRPASFSVSARTHTS